MFPSLAHIGRRGDFDKVTTSIRDLVEQLSALENRSHIALVQFAENNAIRFPLSDVSTAEKKSELFSHLDNTGDELGSKDFISSAINMVCTDIFGDGQHRDTALDVLIVFTNRQVSSDDPAETDDALAILEVSVITERS